MTCDHLRPLLHTWFLVAESFSRGLIPRSVVEIVKLGWMTALRKKDGGVRGIVAGEVIRRLTARTIAQLLGPAVEAATAPFQYALSTRAGCECVSHAFQALCDMDEDATITSIDGISAYDTISQHAMLKRCPEGVQRPRLCGSSMRSRPHTFGRMMLGPPTGSIKAKGVSRGTLMPLLYSLGQHAALEAMHARFHPGEKLFAYLDDVWPVSQPKRARCTLWLNTNFGPTPRSKCTGGRLMSGTGQGGNLPIVMRCSGFVVPSWPALTAGLRLPPREPEFPRAGWAKGWFATRSGQSRGEAVPNNVGFTTAFTKKGHVEVPEWTSGRSCVFCFALFSLDTFPTIFVPCPSATFDFAQLPVWPSSLSTLLDTTACSTSGVLGRRGFAMEGAAARVCREAGARVAKISSWETWIWECQTGGCGRFATVWWCAVGN